MTERPIIFSGQMIRALLDGRKTMTRRIIKWILRDPSINLNFSGLNAVPLKTNGTPIGTWTLDSRGQGGCWEERGTVKTYAVGDRLYVRESYAPRYFDGGKHAFQADWTGESADCVPEPKWTPAIHQFKRDSRITLTVEAVKVERLQDISEEDARAEGVRPSYPLTANDTAKKEFADLWQFLNKKRAPWASNPWVVAISFKVIKANIDAPKQVAA